MARKSVTQAQWLKRVQHLQNAPLTQTQRSKWTREYKRLKAMRSTTLDKRKTD